MDQRDNAINDLSKLDGRPRRHGLLEPGQHLHQFRRPARRRRAWRRSCHVQFAGRADARLRCTAPIPTQNGVGTLDDQAAERRLDRPGRATTRFSSGQIAADLKLRDQTLVQAQTQVDQLAATMASSLSDMTTAGTAVTGPPAASASDTSRHAAGQHDQPDLYRHCDQHPAPDLDRQRDRSDGAAAAERRRTPIRSRSGSISRCGMASVVAQLNTALGPSGLQLHQSIRLHAEPARIGAQRPSMPASSTITTHVDRERHSATARCSPTATRSTPARSPANGSQMTGLCRTHHRQSGRW